MTARCRTRGRSRRRSLTAAREDARGRSEFAGARVSRGGRFAAGDRSSARGAALGCGRARVYRLRVLVGRADFGPRASGCGGGGGGSGGARNELRNDVAARSAAGRDGVRGAAVRGDGALCQLGDGSDDVCGAAGAGFHEARPDREIRGLLSRALGWIPVRGGLGACDAGDCGVSWSAGSVCFAHSEHAVQRCGGARETFSRARRQNRGGDCGAGGGEYGRGAAAERFSEDAARDHGARGRAADFRRSDHWLSSWRTAARKRFTELCRT